MGSVIKIKELIKIRADFKNNLKTVVFTNGVFDIIHRGHVEYLEKAKSLGDLLIVGMNSDQSVKRIKGDKKPIVYQDDRAYVLSNLVMVDYVILFDEDTPFNLISEILPDVLVKGADWKVEDIVGKDLVEKEGGKVVTIEFLPDRSTTNIIGTIIERFCEKS